MRHFTPATLDATRHGIVAALTPAPRQMEIVRDDLTDIKIGRLHFRGSEIKWTVAGCDIRGTAETVDDALASIHAAAKAEFATEGSVLSWRLELFREQRAVADMPEPIRGLCQRLRLAETDLVRAEHRNVLDSAEIARLRAEIKSIEAELASLNVERAA